MEFPNGSDPSKHQFPPGSELPRGSEHIYESTLVGLFCDAGNKFLNFANTLKIVLTRITRLNIIHFNNVDIQLIAYFIIYKRLDCRHI